MKKHPTQSVHIGRTGLVHTVTHKSTTESLNRQIREERENRRPFEPKTILRKRGDQDPQARFTLSPPEKTRKGKGDFPSMSDPRGSSTG